MLPDNGVDQLLFLTNPDKYLQNSGFSNTDFAC